MKDLVSIIMPVYNSSLTIERAIQSVLGQTYKSIELIIVDDGSVDLSYEICCAIQCTDKRVRLIHQENKGPSNARNTALSFVSGSFLMCVDSDDVLHNDAIEKAVKAMYMNKADVCIFGWDFIENEKHSNYIFSKSEMSTVPEILIENIFRRPYYSGGGNPWNKVWRTCSIKERGKINRFDEDIKIYEDLLWCVKNYCKIQKICYLNESLYDYYIYDTSISRMGNKIELRKKYYQGAKKTYDYLQKNTKTKNEYVKKWYRNHLSATIFDMWRNGEKNDEMNKELISLPILPMREDKITTWIKYIFVRLMTKNTKRG